MLRFVSRLPISRRLFIAFAVAAILPSLMIGAMGIFYITQLNNQESSSKGLYQLKQVTSTQSDTLHQMYADVRTLQSNLLIGLANKKEANSGGIKTQVAQINSEAAGFTNGLNKYKADDDPAQSPKMQPVRDALERVQPNSTLPGTISNMLIDTSSNVWKDYQQAQISELQTIQKIANANAGPNPVDADTLAVYAAQINSKATALNTAYVNLTRNWGQLSGYVDSMAAYINGSNSYPSDAPPIAIGTIGAFLLTFIVVIFAGFLVQRSITSPLTELVSLTKRITKGDTSARAKVSSRDEISIVANSMNNMLDNIVHLIQDAQAQRDVLQGQVEKLVSEVSGVGEGDLRVQAEVTADALGVLADSFNYMVEELGSLVVRVKMVAREVEESTTMTSDRMSELVETADRQIQQIANAAIEVERMAQTSQQVANRAQTLASSAREARLSAQGGRQAVQQTIEGMGRIHTNVQETSNKVQTLGERSREINNIVEAISNIAHQTNRLALDAAIQAAMAGENGKGFGAVAADIRRLAERAKEQASSVGRIVRNVRDEIGAVAVSMRDTERETSAGAKLAEEAGTSLESIFSFIERQAREIEVINQMATQQQQSSTDVVQIMQGVSESTQGSSGSTRDAAQNMERMARLAEQLLASVEAFKLRESLNYFTPAANISMLPEENMDGGQLTVSGTFRTVTSTAQPVTTSGVYQPLAPVGMDTGLAQYSPALALSQGNGQQFFPPMAGLPQYSPTLHNAQRNIQQPSTPTGGLSQYSPGLQNIQRNGSQSSTPTGSLAQYSPVLPHPQNNGQPFPTQGNGQSFMPQNEQSFMQQRNGQSFAPQGNGQSFMPQNEQSFMQQGNGQSFAPQGNGQSFMPQGNGQAPLPHQQGNGNSFGQPNGQQWPPSNDWQQGNWRQ